MKSSHTTKFSSATLQRLASLTGQRLCPESATQSEEALKNFVLGSSPLIYVVCSSRDGFSISESEPASQSAGHYLIRTIPAELSEASLLKDDHHQGNEPEAVVGGEFIVRSSKEISYGPWTGFLQLSNRPERPRAVAGEETKESLADSKHNPLALMQPRSFKAEFESCWYSPELLKSLKRKTAREAAYHSMTCKNLNEILLPQKKAIEQALSEVLPFQERAVAAVERIEIKSLSEVRCLVKHPDPIAVVVVAVQILMQQPIPPVKCKKVKLFEHQMDFLDCTLTDEVNTFHKYYPHFIINHLEALTTRGLDTVNEETLELLQPFCDPELPGEGRLLGNSERMRSMQLATMWLGTCVENVYLYCQASKPIRIKAKFMSDRSLQLDEAKARLEITNNRLMQLEAREAVVRAIERRPNLQRTLIRGAQQLFQLSTDVDSLHDNWANLYWSDINLPAMRTQLCILAEALQQTPGALKTWDISISLHSQISSLDEYLEVIELLAPVTSPEIWKKIEDACRPFQFNKGQFKLKELPMNSVLEEKEEIKAALSS